MKERIVYDKYMDEEKPYGWIFYKKKQYLTWKLFLRFASKHFVPCKKCQEKIETMWNRELRSFDSIISLSKHELGDQIARNSLGCLCSSCKKELFTGLATSDIILGNKDYQHLIELSRHWVDDDDSIENVSKEDYNDHKHPAFRVK